MIHLTHMNTPRHTYKRVVSHIWMSHVTRMKTSCPTYEQVTPHIGCDAGRGRGTDYDSDSALHVSQQSVERLSQHPFCAGRSVSSSRASKARDSRSSGVYVCVCVWARVRTGACAHVRVCTRRLRAREYAMFVRLWVYVCVYAHLCVYACMCVCMHACVRCAVSQCCVCGYEERKRKESGGESQQEGWGFTCVCKFACVCVCVCVCECVCVCMCVLVSVCLCLIYTYMCMRVSFFLFVLIKNTWICTLYVHARNCICIHIFT